MATELKADAAADSRKRPKAPLALRVAFVLVLLAIFLLISIRVLNAISIYPPVEMDASLAPGAAEGRADVSEFHVTTEDGVRLYGWVLGEPDAKHNIIAFTGNGEHVGTAERLYTAHARALNARIILFDYRGFGNSEGTPTESGLYEDARAVYAYAANELGWAMGEVILWGRSLGGGPATKLAHELIAADTPPRALILEAPFTCIRDMAGVAMPHLGRPEWLIYECYDNLSRAPELTIPVFHYHGTEDRIIPYEQGETLCEALPTHEHLRLDGVGHNDIWSDPERADMLRARIDEYLGRLE